MPSKARKILFEIARKELSSHATHLLAALRTVFPGTGAARHCCAASNGGHGLSRWDL